ncbi:related to glycerate dehydrogenase [Ramularia collo-cygni]|uniref:Related to glycerate dehydrogenase n=1 Tax=Ramularia collo-cygni TaxID=112498 RepID=A0A2D3V7S8_9PEZI|nr:related to glycerate dehydrogenase [Ramularia collo-cygni]CZT19646.1 related to glycerate dehydrogenase [Ramularia collo-cygni]
MGGGPAAGLLLAILPVPEPIEILNHLRSRFPALQITFIHISPADSRNAAVIKATVPPHLWKQATVLVTLFSFPPEVADVPNLELVHLISAGSNQLQGQPLWNDSDVTITTSSGIHGPQIAEWVIMTGLVASHKYQQLYESQKKKVWDKGGSEYKVRDQVGRRLGVLGYGSIGRQVGRLGKAMGMDVVAYTATPKPTAESRKDHGFVVDGTGDVDGSIPSDWYSGLDKESLHEFLKQDLDWLVVSVPLTKQTQHFLGEEEFKVLSEGGKRPVYVTNIARGQIIDQNALIKALKDGTLAGAALDVTDPEPLPSDSELWGLENVIITPHISATAEGYIERTFKVLEQNLELREKGEKLINVVKRERGY